MNRLPQIVLIGSTLLGSWLGMQAVHESGHVVVAWVTGGRVSQVVLHPLTISRTDVAENPHPLAVVWAGPVIGAFVPLLIWGIAAVLRMPGAFLLRFFAGFCLIANGLYIGFGSLEGIGDCGEMLRHGSPLWQLWLFGVFTTPLGLALWHGQGTYFGLGRHPEPVGWGVAGGSLLLCLVLLVNGLVVGGR